MNKLQFRDKPPERTYTGRELADYRGYKDSLALDFKNKCGYTNCMDFWFGGKNNFQIDHFKPKSKFPKLERNYNNLVYSCSYVNRAKSDDSGDYLDPVNVNYNLHFYRDELGNIYPQEDSLSAKYMYLKLKLYLKRYGIIWMLEQLENRMNILQPLIQESQNSNAIELYLEISFKFNTYLKHLRAIQ
jgi:hypothetical protein